MKRAFVIEADAANRLSRGGNFTEDLDEKLTFELPGVTQIEQNGILYLIGDGASPASRLIVVRGDHDGPLSVGTPKSRAECFNRVVRAGLSRFWPGFVKLPLEWRLFHSGSLLSFQTNRMQTGIKSCVYVDLAPEGTNHVYVYHLSKVDNELLTRAAYDPELFVDAYLGYESALASRPVRKEAHAKIGRPAYNLTRTFPEADITQGMSFSAWRDAKLTNQQRAFFDAPLDGPLRVKGPAGTGKTLVLTMRFIREVYSYLDRGQKVRACFLTHAEETAENILRYLVQIDERGLFFDSASKPGLDLEITTLHSLANGYINSDAENVQPLSLDGSEGRTLQLELIQSVVSSFVQDDWIALYKEGCRPDFAKGVEAGSSDIEHRAFCYDLSDEFANVLEAFGVRGIDEIANRYLRQVKAGERALARNIQEKRVILELYRRFRKELADMGVVSLDQFTADFLAYLNSFRWETLRRERGFDFVFADELHLFNAQERRALGYLLRDVKAPPHVAVAYDPRQSPRNSFFPEAVSARDTIWTEAKLNSAVSPFELTDVFRYTPRILSFLDRLNQHFPGDDLAEDWVLQFGESRVQDGPQPIATEHKSWSKMLDAVSTRARELARQCEKGEQVAVLCLDPDRFEQYRQSSRFEEGFLIIAGRDELGSIGRFRRRIVLSMPEYVAGLQFQAVILVDANANLVSALGGGINGIHRFISAVYLGASRAKHQLEIYGDLGAGGLARPIKDSIEGGLVSLSNPN